MRVSASGFVFCLICFAMSSCAQESTACLGIPTGTAIKIDSIDQAFNLVLNSDDRANRFTATTYLNQQLPGELTEHFGKILFQTSHIPARRRVYDSMGFYPNPGNAQLLAHYLSAEEEIDVKVQIICSLSNLGEIGQAGIRAIEQARDHYPDVYQAGRKRGETSLVQARGSDTAWMIREDSMSPSDFVDLANQAIRHIQK